MARRKRRKSAPAGRVLATGLSATAMLGIVSVLSWMGLWTAASDRPGTAGMSPMRSGG